MKRWLKLFLAFTFVISFAISSIFMAMGSFGGTMSAQGNDETMENEETPNNENDGGNLKTTNTEGTQEDETSQPDKDAVDQPVSTPTEENSNGANTVDEPQNVDGQGTQPEGKNSQDELTPDTYLLDGLEATGNLEIDVKFILPISNIANPNIALEVNDDKGNTQKIDFNGITEMKRMDYKLGDQTGEVSIRKMDQTGEVLNGVDGGKVRYYAVTLYNLKKGTYGAVLSGNAYKTYTVDNIELDDYAKRVAISNEKGLFEVGDVNMDGTVNGADVDQLIANVDKSDAASLAKFDLNRDGKIDIADVAIIATTLNGAKQDVSTYDTSSMIDSAAMKVEAILDGDAVNLFKEEGKVGIKPAKESEDISQTNPAILTMSMEKAFTMSQIRVETGLDNQPEEMIVEVEDENGKVTQVQAGLSRAKSIHYFTDKASEDTIVIDLGGQIAVKKVTIKIVKSAGKNLAEIAEVEFLNNVYEEVPVPVIEVPKNLNVVEGNESATLTYNDMPNVTGFEILLQTFSKDGQIIENEILQTTYTTYEFAGLDNYTTYQASVRAVNGEWRSPYSDPIKFEPKPTRLPPAPDMVTLNPVYAGFNIGWKDMKDTLTYNIYYRKVGNQQYTKIEKIDGTSYRLTDLEVEKEYEVYVTGNNDLGEGKASIHVKGTTMNYVMPDTYNYGLINWPTEGEKTEHIKSVTLKAGNNVGGEFALVDNNYESYWLADTWDTGGFNTGGKAGPIIEFDDFYDIDYMFLVPKEGNAGFTYAKVYYWDENGTMQAVSPYSGPYSSESLQKLMSPNKQPYYKLQLSKPVHTNKIQICLANSVNGGDNAVREIKFYEYNSLQDDVSALFKDDLHVELQDGVNEASIKALEDRVNTKDTRSDEYHPYRDAMLRDIEYARQILNDTAIQDVIVVDQKITTSRNGHLGFSSLSDLQPLGVSVKAGETINIYVGSTGTVMPQVVFTQFYAEANVWKQSVTNLKKGLNVLTAPQIGSLDIEHGGSVYVRYPNAKESGQIKVRVSGGTKIPYLNITGITDEAEIKAKIRAYITELTTYKDSLQQMYTDEGLTFDPSTSVLNTTEIMSRNALFSVGATNAYAGIATGAGTLDAQVDRLYNSLVAFEEMMTLFYNNKGLSPDADDPKDLTPASRVNIRAMRMFDGAFMYAGGDHVGVGHGSVAGLMQGRPNTIEDGELKTTGFFGWGISHEIGHQINQGKTAYAEVTNNIFALLAQTCDDKAAARIEPRYESKIYKKVTSNTIGKSTDVFTTLAMYWQLHLAYDDTATATDTNSIYAKMNRLMRRENFAGYSSDEMLVVYASMAAEKDLSEHFEKWGIVITDQVKATLKEKGLAKEERKIWYLNDDARRYRLKNGARMSEGTTVNAVLSSADNQTKRFTITLGVNGNANADAILGYEIKRNGEVIGFTMENEFVDAIGSMNNRALVYEVTAYDKYLNATATVKLDEVKLSHDGSVNKDNFTITSNFLAENETIDHENPDFDASTLQVNNLIDADTDTAFNGVTRENAKDKTNPYVTINMNTKMDIVGVKYRAAMNGSTVMDNTITKYNIYVSQDGSSWTLAKSGNFLTNGSNDYTDIVYFDKEGTTGGNQLWTYADMSYVKIEAVGNDGISGAEIDVIAPPGDNVDMSNSTIGKLNAPYKYMDSNNEEQTIPAGSVVFKGDYRGHPAFNVMLLVDANDSDVFYEGENFLFAQLNSEGGVAEIASGIWFYVVTPEQYASMQGKSVRAELYRVNDAETNEGQRLTSTSLSVSNLPAYDALPGMDIVDSTKGE